MSESLERRLRAEGKSEKTVYPYALSVRMLRDFVAYQAATRSEATALVRYKSLQQFLRHCVEEEELDISPMVGMRAPKVEPPPVPIVSDEDLKKLLKARTGKGLVDRRDTALVRIFLDTGSRLSEVTELRQGDVDLSRQTMVVRGKGNRLRVVT